MTKPVRISARLAILALAALAPLAAHAHRQWLLPSATVLSEKDAWVTVDAAVSNDLFYFEHVPMRLDNLVVTGPDGKTTVRPENASTGKYRSTFDLHLTQPGTYRVAVVNSGVFASWKDNGQTKRWRGAGAPAAHMGGRSSCVLVWCSRCYARVARARWRARCW